MITALAFTLVLAAPAVRAQNPGKSPPSIDRESDEIPFEKILANPGGLDLNERFARQQIVAGDLRGAATTIERVLILAPGRDRTRLLYAAVLYRLDARVDAERELRVVLGRSAPDDVIIEARRYLKLIEGRKRKTHFDARIGVGYGYDENRNAASDADQNLFFGAPVLLNRDSRRQEDTHTVFSGGLGVTREFGGAKPKKAFANLGYYRGEQTVVNALDLQAYSASGGFILSFIGWEITPTVGVDHVSLSQSAYLRSLAAALRLSRKVRPRVLVWGELRRDDQKFMRTRLVATAQDRTGEQYDISAGVQWVATPRDRLGFSVAHRRKFARRQSLAYRRESLGIDYTRLLGRGTFLAAGLSGQFDRYEIADVTIAGFGRQDNAMIASLLYGAPLELLWKPLSGFLGTLGVERFQQSSNIVNFDYSNNRLSAMISYKWGI
jgi:hypothetical protein